MDIPDIRHQRVKLKEKNETFDDKHEKFLFDIRII
jgi:hypothetical protein